MAAGCIYAGFVAPGHDCGLADSQDNFRGNTAHSVDGSGAHIFPDPSVSDHSTCYAGSHFNGYKCRDHGVSTMFKTKETRMSDMVSIDNGMGMTVQNAGSFDRSVTTLRNSIVYGEQADLADDCPAGHDCWCLDSKHGVTLFSSN